MMKLSCAGPVRMSRDTVRMIRQMSA